MTSEEMLDALVELARIAEIDVRVLPRGSARDGEPPAQSAVCRVRGQLWVVLAAVDPVEDQVEVMAGALQQHAASVLEGRYLPPAVRDRLEAVGKGRS